MFGLSRSPRPLQLFTRYRAHGILHAELPQPRVSRRRDLPFGPGLFHEAKFHVRLPGAEPYLAHQHVAAAYHSGAFRELHKQLPEGPSPQSLVSSVTCQRPESDAVASRVCPAKLTRTVAPASALPQMGTACDLCRMA